LLLFTEAAGNSIGFFKTSSNNFVIPASTHYDMTKKIWLMIALTVALGGLSLYLNKDWFSKDNIQIYHRSRPARVMFLRRKSADNSAIDPIHFGFNHELKLTSLKIIPVSAIETNKYATPIWHLVSDSNSVPIKDFNYGMAIRGMRPARKGVQPDPLEPGVKYRLCVEALTFKGDHDFVPDPRTQ
jgi:hypothetical protein